MASRLLFPAMLFQFVSQCVDVIGGHGFVVVGAGHAFGVWVEIVRVFCALIFPAIDVEQHGHDCARVVPSWFVPFQQTILET